MYALLSIFFVAGPSQRWNISLLIAWLLTIKLGLMERWRHWLEGILWVVELAIHTYVHTYIQTYIHTFIYGQAEVVDRKKAAAICPRFSIRRRKIPKSNTGNSRWILKQSKSYVETNTSQTQALFTSARLALWLHCALKPCHLFHTQLALALGTNNTLLLPPSCPLLLKGSYLYTHWKKYHCAFKTQLIIIPRLSYYKYKLQNPYKYANN